jgi:hypothetical protein
VATRKQLGEAKYIKCGCGRVYATTYNDDDYQDIRLVPRTSRTWSPYCCSEGFEVASEQEVREYNEYIKELKAKA